MVSANIVTGVLFLLALCLYGATEMRIEWHSRQEKVTSSTTQSDGGSKVGLFIAMAIGVVVALAAQTLPWLTISSPAPAWPLFVLAALLLLIAAAGRLWAVRSLGRWFTTDVRTDSAQPVVDIGPYRWVRHPSYTAALLASVAIGLALDNWVSLAAMIVFPVLGFANRIRTEERALLSALGDAYREYARTHRRLVPGLW